MVAARPVESRACAFRYRVPAVEVIAEHPLKLFNPVACS
jgi:hypothetical protein